jgi:hypothetical protein
MFDQLFQTYVNQAIRFLLGTQIAALEVKQHVLSGMVGYPCSESYEVTPLVRHDSQPPDFIQVKCANQHP